MKRRLARLLAAALTVLFGVVGLSVVQSPSGASAADASRFDPGLIISDSVFFDFGSMSEAAIQNFLESKVPNCKAVTGQPKCLRDYVTNIPDTVGTAGHCASITGQQNVKASTVIYQVAHGSARSLVALVDLFAGQV